MPKILYITYDGLTDPLGQSQVLPYLLGLEQKGYHIHILSFEKKKAFFERKETIKKRIEDKNITWHKKFYTKFPPVLSTLYDVLVLKRKAKRINRKFGNQITHCRGYIAAFGGLYLKQKLNIPFIFDMRGFYADERVDGDLWDTNNTVYKRVYNYFKKQEKIYIQEADYTISLTEVGKNIIQSWKFRQDEEIPIGVIPCCADFNHFCMNETLKKKTEGLKKELNFSENDFVLTYLGSIGTWYLLDEMLDFFAVLLDQFTNAKFLFISGDDASFIQNRAAQKGIEPSRIIVRKAAREDVPAYITLGKLSVFFIKPVFSKKASSPTKMAEIMGMGIPIIANSNVGDVDKIIQDSQTGLLVNEFTKDEYQRVIGQLDVLLKTNPQKIREAAIKYFSLEDGVEKYHQVYQKVLNK